MKTEQTLQPTPGTWRVAWGKIIDQDDKAICMLTYRKNAWNGDLIAAAPDMRDALQAIVDAWGYQDSLLIELAAAPEMRELLQAVVDAYGHQNSLLIEQAKAALAKAERRAE